jgi:small subunit ribosomal protein S6
MKTYESIFIVKPELTTEEASKILEFYTDNITSNGGKVITTETWGRMKLAYEIENCKEGYYFLIHFEADSEYPSELSRRYKFNEDVIRNIIVQLDGKKFKGRNNRTKEYLKKSEKQPEKTVEKPVEKKEETKEETKTDGE